MQTNGVGDVVNLIYRTLSEIQLKHNSRRGEWDIYMVFIWHNCMVSVEWGETVNLERTQMLIVTESG